MRSFHQRRLDTPLGLAIGLRPVWPRELVLDIKLSAGPGEVPGAEG